MVKKACSFPGRVQGWFSRLSLVEDVVRIGGMAVRHFSQTIGRASNGAIGKAEIVLCDLLSIDGGLMSTI